MTRPFRFGVVAPLRSDLTTWLDNARRIAGSGYATLLMPDFPLLQPSPAPILATAAAVTGLGVGTWVYASPLRPAWLTAWESHSLSLVTGGRFEMGIGTGRPGIDDELRDKGMPPVPPGERLDRIRDTVRALREYDGADRHTPIAMAVRGPKARALAAEVADTVTFVQAADEPPGEVTRLAHELRAVSDAELANAVSIVGDRVAPHMAPPGIDTAAAHAAGSLVALPADPAAAADEIERRRAEIGFSYVVVGADVADAFAPVVARLAGR